MPPVSELLFLCCIQCNPIRHSTVQAKRRDQAVLDPVVDHAVANSKVFGRLLNGQFLRLLEHSRWDAMAPTDPNGPPAMLAAPVYRAGRIKAFRTALSAKLNRPHVWAGLRLRGLSLGGGLLD